MPFPLLSVHFEWASRSFYRNHNHFRGRSTGFIFHSWSQFPTIYCWSVAKMVGFFFFFKYGRWEESPTRWPWARALLAGDLPVQAPCGHTTKWQQGFLSEPYCELFSHCLVCWSHRVESPWTRLLHRGAPRLQILKYFCCDYWNPVKCFSINIKLFIHIIG